MEKIEEKFAYLNLEYLENNKRRSIDDVQIYCFSKTQSKHKFHSENTHLNTISDLVYSLVQNLDCENNLLRKIQKDFLTTFQKQNIKLESFEEKLDFLRNQQKIKKCESETVQQLLQEIKILHQKVDSLEKTIQKIESYIKSM